MIIFRILLSIEILAHQSLQLLLHHHKLKIVCFLQKHEGCLVLILLLLDYLLPLESIIGPRYYKIQGFKIQKYIGKAHLVKISLFRL